MTTFFEASLKCAVCGKKSKHPVIGSTSMFGSYDLDGRPPPPHGENIEYLLQACPRCGYSANDITKADERAAEVIRSMEFAGIWRDQTHPRGANQYLRAAFLSEKLGDLIAAGWASLHAAWVCDSSEKGELAQACRMEALRIFESCRKADFRFCGSVSFELIVLADICRRLGEFEKAQSYCNGVEALETGDPAIDSLKYESVLCSNKDTGRHSSPQPKEIRIII